MKTISVGSSITVGVELLGNITFPFWLKRPFSHSIFNDSCEIVIKLLKSNKHRVSNKSIGGLKNPKINKRTPTAIRDSRVPCSKGPICG